MGFLTLLSLAVVLGIDKVVFISILASKLPKDQQARARKTGLTLVSPASCSCSRCRSWWGSPTRSSRSWAVAGRDIILIVGGLFLIAKSTYEIHDRLEGEPGHAVEKVAASFMAVVVQILLLDIVFSLDSVSRRSAWSTSCRS